MVTYGLQDIVFTGISATASGAVALSVNNNAVIISRKMLNGSDKALAAAPNGASCTLECAELSDKKFFEGKIFDVACKTADGMVITLKDCYCTGFAFDCKTIGKGKEITTYKISLQVGDIIYGNNIANS